MLFSFVQEFPELEREKKKVGGREGWEATRGSTHTHRENKEKENARECTDLILGPPTHPHLALEAI